MLDVAHGERILRATVRRHGDEMIVQTNSEARLDRVLALLADVGQVEVVSTRPVRNLSEVEAAMADLSPQESTDGIESVPSDLADQIVDMMERRWLDEEVPALGGATLEWPRSIPPAAKISSPCSGRWTVCQRPRGSRCAPRSFDVTSVWRSDALGRPVGQSGVSAVSASRGPVRHGSGCSR